MDQFKWLQSSVRWTKGDRYFSLCIIYFRPTFFHDIDLSFLREFSKWYGHECKSILLVAYSVYMLNCIAACAFESVQRQQKVCNKTLFYISKDKLEMSSYEYCNTVLYVQIILLSFIVEIQFDCCCELVLASEVKYEPL